MKLIRFALVGLTLAASAVYAAPTVSITAPANNATFVAPASITIGANAAASSGTISKVDFYNGATKIGTDTTSPYSFAWTNVAVGTYTITAKATDSAGAVTTSAAITVKVNANVAPTVGITAPANNAAFASPAAITINATAADTDGTIAKVDFYNGTTLLGTDITSPYSYAWANVAVGTYTITAKSTDDKGAQTTSAAITVKVNANVAPTVSISAPANNASFTAPAAITINANAADTDGTIAKVDFYNGTTLLGTDSTSPYSYSWTNVAAGTYSIAAKATDDKGAITTSSAISVTVGTNQAPTVSITSPVANASFAAPASITINANAADADGTISKVEFYNGATLLGTDTTSPYSYAWNNVATGTYSVTAKATDNKGAVTTSAAVSVSVANNQLPTITFDEPIDNGPTIYAPADITLGATASDADGTIAKVEFFKGTTKLGEATSAPYRFTWAAVAAGTYSLTAKATDNRGATTTSVVKTVAVIANPAPVAIYLRLQGASVRDKAVYPESMPLTFSIYTNGGATHREILANNTVVCSDDVQFSFSCNPTQFAAGTYVVSAKVTGSNGVVNTKIAGTIFVETTPSVAVTFTKPSAAVGVWIQNIAIEGTFSVPASGSFKVYHARDCAFTGTEIETEIPATIVGNAFTATFDGSTAPCIGNIKGRAVATDGRNAETKVVLNPKIALLSIMTPVGSTTTYTPSVAAEVLADIPPNAVVQISGVTAIVTPSGTYKTIVPLTIGQNTISATATLGGSVIATSASSYVTYTAPIDRTLTVASPTEGEKRYYSNYDPAKSAVAVTGSFTGPAVTTVMVRDTFGSMHVADILNGNFTANVPVSEQDNWIDVTAYGPGGATAQKRVHFYITNSTSDAITLTSPTSCSVIPATPANLTLSAITRSAYPIVRVNYLANGSVVGTSTTPPFTVQWNGVGDGSYQISAVSYKSDLNSPGGTAEIRVATSVESRITIGAPNVSPTCSLLSPQDGAIYLRNASFPVEAIASDPDGSIAKVDFYVDFNLPVGQAPINLYQGFTAPPYKLTVGLSNPGVYTISTKATDNRGATKFCPATQIQVSTNTAPTISLTGPSAGTVINDGGGAIIEPGVSSNVARVQLWRGSTMLAEQTATPFTFTLTQLAAGSYSIFARAIDNLGVSADSNTINFVVNAFPVVSINLPAQDSQFAAPATVPISVNATDADGTIQRVEIFSSTTLLATLTSPPYTFNWANVPEGSYSISAKAFDNVGASAVQNNFSRSITVKATVSNGTKPIIWMNLPLNGTAYAAPAQIPMQADVTSANSTISKVEFFANDVKLGESNTAPYRYAWINAPAGAHRVSATATDALGASTNSGNYNVTVVSSASLSNIAFNGINAPVGSTTAIANDRVMVTGKVVMPLNAALGINGYLASVDQSGNFFVNNVLLKSGNNTITFTINQFGAAQVTETRIVNATGLQDFVLSINPTEGVAPTTFTLTITREGTTPFDRIELAAEGTLIATLTTANFRGNTAIASIGPATFADEITLTAKAFAPNATTPFYTGTIKARVTDPQDKAVKVKAVLEQFRAKLLASDVTGAVQFFTEPLRNYYQTRLTLIAPDLPLLAAELANPVSISVQGDTATVLINRQVGPNTFAFTLSLIRDADAIWRIDGM